MEETRNNGGQSENSPPKRDGMSRELVRESSRRPAGPPHQSWLVPALTTVASVLHLFGLGLGSGEKVEVTQEHIHTCFILSISAVKPSPQLLGGAGGGGSSLPMFLLLSLGTPLTPPHSR